MTPSFWKRALASLPPQVQWRYAAAFEAAERFERTFDIVWNTGRHMLAMDCRLAAQALGASARFLDAAARRLSFSR